MGEPEANWSKRPPSTRCGDRRQSEIDYVQPVIRPWIIFSATLALVGCGSAIATDGSPEAGRVAAWLSSSQWISWVTDDPVVPGAVLVMSDFGRPLTLGNLRQSGPDRIAGCALARVERTRSGVAATWSCATHVDLPQRQVEFDMLDGRIRAARYTEAYQALSANVH
jgi:hypothetical protein